MLTINSHSDKLRSTYNKFKSHGMLKDSSELDELMEGQTSSSFVSATTSYHPHHGH